MHYKNTRAIAGMIGMSFSTMNLYFFATYFHCCAKCLSLIVQTRYYRNEKYKIYSRFYPEISYLFLYFYITYILLKFFPKCLNANYIILYFCEIQLHNKILLIDEN